MIEFPIFTWEPDFRQPPRSRFLTRVDALNQSPAPQYLAWPQQYTDRVTVWRFTFEQSRDCRDLKHFFNTAGGRAGLFLMPSWNRDFVAASIPSAGTTLVTVEIEDYAGMHLALNVGDEVGRYVFCCDPLNALQVMRVITAEAAPDPENSVLELEQPLLFTPSEQAFWGFAYVSRFEEDELAFTHYTPNHGTVELATRTTRQRSNLTQTDALADEDVEASLAFEELVAEPSTAGRLRWDYSHALGPLLLHVVQAQQFTRPYAAWLGTSTVRIAPDLEEGDVWPPDDSLGLPSDLFGFTRPNAEHMSLAFDQNGWEVIAWQTKGTTQISIRRFFNFAITTHTFAGTFPVLFQNGVANVDEWPSGSDVFCFFLKPNLNVVFARVQRDNFSIEYKFCLAPQQLFTLDRVTYDVDTFEMVLEGRDTHYRLCKWRVTYPEPPPIPPSPPYFIEDASVGISAGDGVYVKTHALGGEESDAGSCLVGPSGAYLLVSGDNPQGDEGNVLLLPSGNYETEIIPPPPDPEQPVLGTVLEVGPTLVIRPTGLYPKVLQDVPGLTDQQTPTIVPTGNCPLVIIPAAVQTENQTPTIVPTGNYTL